MLVVLGGVTDDRGPSVQVHREWGLRAVEDRFAAQPPFFEWLFRDCLDHPTVLT